MKNMSRTVSKIDSCGYWPREERTSRVDFDLAATPLMRTLEDWRAVKFYNLEQGKQSSSSGVYSVACTDCPTTQFCRASRIDLSRFSMSASQQQKFRTFRSMVTLDIQPGGIFDPDVYALYKRYVGARHADARTPMADFSAEEYKKTYERNKWLVTARLDNRALIAASIVDQHKSDFSAEYQMYDLDYGKMSPGISMTLSLLSMMREMEPFGHMYFGVWSSGSPKTGYKSLFHGTEIYEGGRWTPLEHTGFASRPAMSV